MGFKVILTPQSLDDLKEIIFFIAKEKPEHANSFANELIDRAKSIAFFPERGRIVPEIGESAVREITQGEYRIIFEMIPDRKTIHVLRFWRGSKAGSEIMSVS